MDTTLLTRLRRLCRVREEIQMEGERVPSELDDAIKAVIAAIEDSERSGGILSEPQQ